MARYDSVGRASRLTLSPHNGEGSSIDVPDEMGIDEAIEYAKAHLDEAPLGTLEYVRDSDILDEENCDFG